MLDDLGDPDLEQRPGELSGELDVVHDDRTSRAKWVALGVMLLAVGSVLGYSWLRRPPPAAPASTVVSTPQPDINLTPSARVLEGEKIPLPSLSESDPLVRDLIVKLSSHPQVLAWLTTKGLIENFTVVTLNISEGQTPVTHIKALAPRTRFRVKTMRDGIYLDPAGYRRYDEYAAAIGALDTNGTARLYLTLKPRILDAYRTLGHPDGDFDPVLEHAIAVLLAVPVIDGDIRLREKVLSYEFADQNLESLSSAQRQFLRMGPANMGIVQGKLREIAKILGLRPDPSLLRD